MRHHSSCPRFNKTNTGQSLPEYAMVGGIVVIASIAALSLLGGSVTTLFSNATQGINPASMKSMTGASVDDSATWALLSSPQSTDHTVGNASQSGSSGNKAGGNPFGISLTDSANSGVNVSSAEGTQVNLATPTFGTTLSSATELKKLADETGSGLLLGISQQALLSAAHQGTYSMVTHPNQVASPQLQAMRTIVAGSMSNAELQNNPKIVLGKVTLWTNSMESALAQVKTDPALNPAQRTQAVKTIEHIISTTRTEYGATALTQALADSSKLSEAKYINLTETYDALRREAKTALKAGDAKHNEALKSAMESGVAEHP